MTNLALRSEQGLQASRPAGLAQGWRKLPVVALVAALLAVPGETGAVVMEALADAYLQVTVFVAWTLAVFYGIERLLAVDLGRVMARHLRWQPAIAASLGALPGCGGAIIVATQFTRGQASFGALVSVLVTTMGDAAFLLIAAEPGTALLVAAVSLVVGTLSGLALDALKGPAYLRPGGGGAASTAESEERPEMPRGAALVWFALLGPGLALGILEALQLDPDGVVGVDGLSLALGASGAGLCLVLWALWGGSPHRLEPAGAPFHGRVVAMTNFVTAWVVMAFLAYELSVHAAGLDVGALFEAWMPLMPVVGVLVGFVPGCGPQIVVTTLYVTGAIPLSSQLANAISNDGDALFPVIAMAPRAAIAATLYSAMPALLVGYGWLMLME